MDGERPGRLLAISDLHIGYAENRAIVEELVPTAPGDWLIVAGDVSEKTDDIAWASGCSPSGSHGWCGSPATTSCGPAREGRRTARSGPLRGAGGAVPAAGRPHARGPLPGVDGLGRPGPGRAALPAVRLHLAPGGHAHRRGVAGHAYKTGVVCNDEFLLHADPYPDRDAWCRDRVALTERRLAACDPTCRTC